MAMESTLVLSLASKRVRAHREIEMLLYLRGRYGWR